MQKVLLLLLLCVFVLALSTRRNRFLPSPSTAATEELSPEMVPFYLVTTFSIPEMIIHPKRSSGCGTHKI
jgi:hypothetical protein